MFAGAGPGLGHGLETPPLDANVRGLAADLDASRVVANLPRRAALAANATALLRAARRRPARDRRRTEVLVLAARGADEGGPLRTHARAIDADGPALTAPLI